MLTVHSSGSSRGRLHFGFASGHCGRTLSSRVARGSDLVWCSAAKSSCAGCGLCWSAVLITACHSAVRSGGRGTARDSVWCGLRFTFDHAALYASSLCELRHVALSWNAGQHSAVQRRFTPSGIRGNSCGGLRGSKGCGSWHHCGVSRPPCAVLARRWQLLGSCGLRSRALR